MKKIFAVVMVLVMLFALCAVPAMAAKNSPTGDDAPTTPDKPVTSPDTSDVFGLAVGALALVDGAAVVYYLKNRKDK